MHRRSRAGQIVNAVDFHQDGVDQVMPDQLEIGVVQQMGDIPPSTGKKIVQADDLPASSQQAFTQMRTDKTGAAGDEYPFFVIHAHRYVHQK